jgi:hypothetical protein
MVGRRYALAEACPFHLRQQSLGHCFDCKLQCMLSAMLSGSFDSVCTHARHPRHVIGPQCNDVTSTKGCLMLCCLKRLLREHAPGSLLAFLFRHGRAAMACELLFPPADTPAGSNVSDCAMHSRWVFALKLANLASLPRIRPKVVLRAPQFAHVTAHSLIAVECKGGGHTSLNWQSFCGLISHFDGVKVPAPLQVHH